MSGPHRSGRRAEAARGFTLVELLVAITLMAVLAVLGWRGLSSVLDSRERIVAASDALRALTVGFAQVDEDLRRAWPVRLLQTQVPPIGFVAAGQGETPALQLLREMPPAPGAARLQRVVYRLRDGRLERGFAPWSPPAADDRTARADPELVWQPLLAGVRSVQMRGWVDGRGWIPASGMLWRPGASVPGLVTGLEVLVEYAGGERVVRIFSVRD